MHTIGLRFLHKHMHNSHTHTLGLSVRIHTCSLSRFRSLIQSSRKLSHVYIYASCVSALWAQATCCIASTFASRVDKNMTDSRQDLLRSAWLDAKDGSLSGREQAKAWALREIWKDSGKADYGMKTFIAGKLKKKGGGSPSAAAVYQLFEKVDADDD